MSVKAGAKGVTKPEKAAENSSFFSGSDVVTIARSLIGKHLYSHVDGEVTGGIIIETEAYCERSDLAMKKHLKRRPSSIETLKRRGGIAYIYTVYGHHSLFNIVTNNEGHADSVLVRAIEPTTGIDVMVSRRNGNDQKRNLCSGPAKLTQALAITPKFNGVPIPINRIPISQNSEKPVWIENSGESIPYSQIKVTPRIGIDYAEEDAKLPWRFKLV
ncbi:DNA-3-methyladenine glycosylase [Alteromonas gracilis]|uniref:DNA-3-methyladenine glycosylase n=1 Tax=Alteromonas gracilis TaxID=1479524 RepID=UPI003736D94C